MKRKTWSGPLAPYEVPTGDRRIFSRNGLTHRDLPLPIMWQKFSEGAHRGAVVVGRILDIETDDGFFRGSGDWFDPSEVPEVSEALALTEGGVIGPSVDLEPDFTVEVDTTDPEKPMLRYLAAKVAGATLVPMAAFGGLRLSIGADSVSVFECGCEGALAPAFSHDVTWCKTLPRKTINGRNAFLPRDDEMAGFALSNSGWKSMPIAPREAPFDADDAFARIIHWANGSVAKAGQAFLWKNPQVQELGRDTFRLPIADIYGGKPTLVFHAVYAAAALLAGAHGGLPDVPEQEKAQLRKVISEIYTKLASHFQDAKLEAPWDKRARMDTKEKGGQLAMGGVVDPVLTGGPDGDLFLVASAAPVTPPKEWFTNPGLTGPQPLRVQPDGRVFGHLATWDTCHLSVGQGACVTAPKSAREYAYFRTGEVLTEEGDFVPVGKITIGTGHADTRLGLVPALAHYDNTGSAVAVVNVGEDAYGIWVAGALCPEASEEQVAALRRSPLSGDWRQMSGNLELVAALAVNTPGFPVTSVNRGRQVALVAAGVLSPDDMRDTSGAPIDVSPTPIAIEEKAPVVDLDAMAIEVARRVEARNARVERLATVVAIEQAARADRLKRVLGGDV